MHRDSERHRRLREVFDEALLLDAAGRRAYLDHACDGDAELHAQAARLLAVHDASDSFLEHPPRLPADSEDAAFPSTDRFRVIRPLGKGGMGVVYEVRDARRNEVVALKTLRRNGAVDLYRLKREFRSMADVAHPNIVCLYELFVEDDRPFFTMELVRGVNFVEFVRGADRLHLSIERLVPALQQLTLGLSALHRRGMLHRDVKPSNVLVTPGGRTVLLDFGLVAGGDDRSRDTIDGGTPAYMAPEESAGATPSPAGDWYGVGATLYEALTGRLPFEGSVATVLRDKRTGDPRPPKDVDAAVPDDLSVLCMTLLHRDPVDRAHADAVLRIFPQGPVRLPSPKPSTLFVGRRDELGTLHDAESAVRRGDARTVSLHGPSGIGKTALVRAFVTNATQNGAMVLAGRCYENESIPYKGLDGVVDELSRLLLSLPDETLEALLPRGSRELTTVFPVLRGVPAMARAAARTGAVDVDPFQLRRRALAALRRLLRDLACRQPLVVWIDDLQWADADSMQLLDELLAPPDPPPMLTLLSFRGEAVAPTPFLRALIDRAGRDGHQAVPLEPLSDSESRQMVDGLMAATTSLAAADQHRLMSEAAGSPFMLEQLAWYAVDAAATSIAAPTLAGMLDTRLDALAVEARAFLQTLAICGRPMASDVMCDASGVDTDRQTLIVTLRASHLIRASGSSDRVEPYHDRIREALAARVRPELTRDIHRRVAAALIARHSDDSEALFEHHRGAGEHELAAVQAGAAAAKAADTLAFDRAATFYQHAIALSPATSAVPAWKRQLAVALTNAGRPAEAAEAYLQAAHSVGHAEQVELHRAAAEQFLIGGHIDRGLDLLRDVLTRLGLSVPSTPRVAAVRLVGRRVRLWCRGLSFDPRPVSEVPADVLVKLDACWAAGTGLALVDIVTACDFLAQHLHMALDSGELSRIARGMAIEFSARSSDWTFRSSARRFEALSAALSARVDTPQALAMQLLADSIAACATGQWNRAQSSSERALTTLRDHCVGVNWEMSIAQNMFIWSLMYRGQLGELSRRVPLLLEDARRRGNLYLATELVTRSNFVWLAADDPDSGAREVDATMAQWSQKGFHRQHYSAMLARMQTALYRGDPETAWRVLDDSESRWRASMLMQVQALRVEYRYMRGRCAIAMATVDADPRRWLSRARGYARRIAHERMPWSTPIALLLEGGIAAVAGDRPAAVHALTRAVEQFDAADMQLYANVSRQRIGDLLDDDYGRAMRQDAATWMAEQQIRDPIRFTRMFAPGFAGAGRA